MASCSAQPSARALDRAPMSERQQLALIKQMERSSSLTATATTGSGNSPVVAPAPSAAATSPTSNDCSQVSSPPRTPLQVVNGHHNRLQMLSGQTIPAVNSPTVSTNQPTPAEDKLRKRLTRKNEKGETPLHRAAIRGSKKVAKKILMLGVDPNVADNAGWTPLHEACNHGNLSVARLLVKHGADVNLYGGVGEQRQTALHDAARNGHFEVVRFLIKKGANIAAKKENGRTPLDEAKSSTADNPDLAEVIQFLTEHQENGGSFSDSDSSSDDSEDDSDRDLAKFLGLSSSPSVEKFLQKIGLGTASEPASPVPQQQLTDSEKKKPLRKTQRQRDSNTQRSDKSSRGCESSSKIRLSFNMEGTSDDVGVGPSKSASSCPASRTSSPVLSMSSRVLAPAARDKSEDPYEFKTSSCDEPAMLSHSGDKCKEPLLKDEKKAAEKRAINGEEVEDDGKKKKRKDEKEKERESRGVRGVKANLTVKPAMKGRGILPDRNSPLPVNNGPVAANSPRRKSLGCQSDSEEDPSRKASLPNMPKVPPLKIVLSGTANLGSNGQQDSEKRPGGRGSKDDSSITVVDEIGVSDVGNDPKATSSSRMTRSRANHGPSGNDSNEQGLTTDPSPGATLDPVPIPDAPAPAPTVGPTTITSFTSSFSDYHLKKRKLRSQLENVDNSNSVAASNNSNLSTSAAIGGNSATKSCLISADGTYSVTTFPATSIEPLNDIQKYLNIRRQVEQRRKNLFPVQPKPPQGFKDYLMNRKTYLLQGNQERLRSIPVVAPPPTLEGPLRELFVDQEKQRHDLRKKHQVEKEKLVLAVEQEILRVHGRAARALANQSLPYSVCTILKDEEIYAPIDMSQEEKNRDIRSRYNGRLFLSWLQDVDDKWEKIKEQMVLRHHNEAESLNAVQKMDWEWKVNDHYINVNPRLLPPMDELHIPMVHVSDDFDLSDAK